MTDTHNVDIKELLDPPETSTFVPRVVADQMAQYFAQRMAALVREQYHVLPPQHNNIVIKMMGV